MSRVSLPKRLLSTTWQTALWHSTPTTMTLACLVSTSRYVLTQTLPRLGRYHTSAFKLTAYIIAQADKEADIDSASWAVMHEISKLAYNVDADQITRAKNQLKAQILFSQDGPSGTYSSFLTFSNPFLENKGKRLHRLVCSNMQCSHAMCRCG